MSACILNICSYFHKCMANIVPTDGVMMLASVKRITYNPARKISFTAAIFNGFFCPHNRCADRGIFGNGTVTIEISAVVIYNDGLVSEWYRDLLSLLCSRLAVWSSNANGVAWPLDKRG